MIRHEKPKEIKNVYEYKHLRTSLSIQYLFQSSLLFIYSQVESHNTCRKQHSIMTELIHKSKPSSCLQFQNSQLLWQQTVMNILGGGGKKKRSWYPSAPTQRPNNPGYSPICPTPSKGTQAFSALWQTKAWDSPKLRQNCELLMQQCIQHQWLSTFHYHFLKQDKTTSCSLIQLWASAPSSQ